MTPSRKSICPDVLQVLSNLRQRVTIGVVGGSDFVKQKEQLGDHVLDLVDYSFSENGLIAYHNKQLIHSKSIKEHLGEERIKSFINFVLHYIADLDIPIKRGTFVEFRTGLINVSPIGRNCSQQERDHFEVYDKDLKIRETMVNVLKEKFKEYNLKFSIGGQISFDVFPIGWDKTYCLQHLKNFKTIHFFGDKTEEGGNDHEIFSHPSVQGHTVKNPDDTVQQLKTLFLQ
uniref:Phosphomannomutase n=1 Tax=Arcella intermedia TaxID=1963864 RepID=A0A6B2LGD2_9EUKA